MISCALESRLQAILRCNAGMLQFDLPATRRSTTARFASVFNLIPPLLSSLRVFDKLGSLGALLDHLVRVRAVGELEDEGIGGLDIRDIESLALKEVMQINADALHSLQIFDNENHASVHSDKTKEGLSLFGILNNTRTSLGRNLMRQWLLRPSTSISVITARHDAVACFMRPENINTANSMHNHLKGIKNVPKVLGALNSGKAKISDWLGLVKVRIAALFTQYLAHDVVSLHFIL